MDDRVSSITETRDTPVYFYLSSNALPHGELPGRIEDYWRWVTSAGLEKEWWGQYHWILQTHLHLIQDGFSCRFVNSLPAQGIVVAFREDLPDHLRPAPGVLLVCVLADEHRPHPYAHLHVVQNPRQQVSAARESAGASYHIPHWPQPGLIPRCADRGDKFENVAYIGYERNLARELRDPQWGARLRGLGLHWQLVGREHFHDYSDIDVVVAVRSFDRRSYNHKPASKLYNAWLAGIPAILGPESAYRSVGRNNVDYLEASSPDEVAAGLLRLRDDLQFRHQIVTNGWSRSRDIEPARVVREWRHFLADVAKPAYHSWCEASPATRQLFLLQRAAVLRLRQARRVTGSFRDASRVRIRSWFLAFRRVLSRTTGRSAG